MLFIYKGSKNLIHIFAVIIYYFNSQIIMAHRITETCTACGTCIDECPVDAISPGDIYVIDPDECIDCGACAAVCPVGAILAE